MRKPLITFIIGLILLAAIIGVKSHFKNVLGGNQTNSHNSQTNTQNANTAPNTQANKPNSPAEHTGAEVLAPISNPSSRITKKFFGTYVTPQNSPVKPERFTGFHTGLDFETTPDEQNSDVQITSMCEGKLLAKGYASGYGGYAVQSCILSGKEVTVIYGHLRQSSIKPDVGAQLNAGDPIAVLGTGYSKETDGERKHLHLGIHIGSAVDIKGYVQSKDELSGWLDPKIVLGL